MISGHGLWRHQPAAKLRCVSVQGSLSNRILRHMSELSWLGPVIWKEETTACVTVLCLSFWLHKEHAMWREGGSQTSMHSLLSEKMHRTHGSWEELCLPKAWCTGKSRLTPHLVPKFGRSHVPQSFCPGLFRTSVLLPVTLDAPGSWTPETTACFLWGPCQRPEQSQKSQHSLKLIQETLQITSPAGQTIL